MWKVQGVNDEGRIVVGPFIALLLVVGAAFGAYWLLGEYGFLGSDEEEVKEEVQVEEEHDPRPEWLHNTDFELPPLKDGTEEDEQGEGDEGEDKQPEPAYHEPEGWVWELVDESWTPTVVREGEGDNYTWLSDFQALYIVSPTDNRFKIRELDTVFNEDVVHWDPERLVVWLERGGKAEPAQVVEYDLRSGDATTDFAGNIFSGSNVVRQGVANMDFVAQMEDGRDLWVTHSPEGYVTGVAFRDGENWDGSLLTDQVRRMAQQDMGTDRGVDGWFDPDNNRAVYHGVYLDPNTRRLSEEMWVLHDLATDGVDPNAVVPVPNENCKPVDSPRAGTFDGDRIIADCGGTEYLLDPYSLNPPIER